MYEIVSWPLLITAALCFTTQGCVLPAPGWPMAPNYCSGAKRNFFKSIFIEIMCWAPRISHVWSTGLLSISRIEHSLATSENLGVSFNRLG